MKYEIILVDDCSPDGTRAVIEALILKYPDVPIRKVYHEHNQGRGAAFMTGFGVSTGEYVGFFDIDLEVSAVYMIEALRVLCHKRSDLVVGLRIYKVSFLSFYRHILSRCYRLLVATCLRIPIALDSESGYKFFRRAALQKYVGRFHYKGWFWDTEVVTRFYRDGMKVDSFPCLFIRDGSRRSTLRPIRDSIEYIRNLIGFRRQLSREKRPLVETQCTMK